MTPASAGSAAVRLDEYQRRKKASADHGYTDEEMKRIELFEARMMLEFAMMMELLQ